MVQNLKSAVRLGLDVIVGKTRHLEQRFVESEVPGELLIPERNITFLRYYTEVFVVLELST